MPQPTGRVTTDSTGAVLLTLTRRFEAPAAEVWESLTDPALTARWLGPWRGEPGAGHTIELQMSFEEGDAWSAARIEECDPPRRLRVTTLNETGDWPLEASLTEDDGTTTLGFVHHLTDVGGAEFIGPGWEYYLDNLVASRAGQPLPDFADYFPAQAEYYAEQARRIDEQA